MLESPHRRGIAYILAAFSVLLCLDACAKFLVQAGAPIAGASWSRYLGHMICVLAVAWPSMRSTLWKTKNLPFQLVRGACLVVMSLLYFLALKTLPLAHATAILFVSPLLITLWARLFLGEKVKPIQWVALAVGFVGVLVVCRPGGGLDMKGALFALAAATLNSLYQTLTRRMSSSNSGGGDAPMTQLFYAGLIGTALLTVSMPAWWTPISLTPVGWTAFVGIGALGALGHWLLTKAYEDTPVAVLAPWMYFQLALSVVVGWALFGDMPDAVALAGMGLIAVAPQIVRAGKAFG